MEPARGLPIFNVIAEDNYSIPGINEARALAAEIDNVEPVAPPSSFEDIENSTEPAPRSFNDLVAAVEPVGDGVDLSAPSPFRTPIRRSQASADLSSEVQTACDKSKRESIIVDNILVHLNSNDFKNAINLYHELTISSFKKTAFNTITNKLCQEGEIANHFAELSKNIPADFKDEKIFNISSDDISTANNFAKVVLNKLYDKQLSAEEKYKEKYEVIKPLINNTINNTLAIYTLLNNDSLRCALIFRLYTFIYTFPEAPLPKFPVQQYIDSGIRTLDALKEMRKEHDVTVAGLAKIYRDFENETISMLKNKIETYLLKFHLTEEKHEALISFLKNVCSPEHKANFLMFSAIELIGKGKIEAFPYILQGIYEVRHQYSVEVRPNVENMIVQAIVLVTKKDRKDLAEEFFKLVPHKKDEILTLLAVG